MWKYPWGLCVAEDNHHQFITQTNNPVMTMSAKHCQTNSEVTCSVIPFWISDLSVYMCTISLIWCSQAMLKYSHNKGESWYISFLKIRTKTKNGSLFKKNYEGENTLLNCNSGVSLPSRAMKNVEPCQHWIRHQFTESCSSSNPLTATGICMHVVWLQLTWQVNCHTTSTYFQLMECN